jgi:hypothetical protein
MKSYEGVEARFHTCLVSTLNVGERSASHGGHPTPEKELPVPIR